MLRRILAIGAAVAVVIGLLIWFTQCGPNGDCGPAITGPGPVQQVRSASADPTGQVESASPTTSSPQPKSSPTSTVTKRRIDPASGLWLVDLADLPPEASDTMDAIRAGGPFQFDKDGTTFRNAERILPKQPLGYYAEFTVVTPGERTRGARRIVTGGPKFGTVNDEFYYTADHYQSFERIRP